MVQRQKILVEGIVQGVGFRPFIYQLAKRLHLAGAVWNDSRGVTIDVEGTPQALTELVAAIRREAPPLAVIQALTAENLPVGGADTFTILASVQDPQRRAEISPDTFVCADCRAELFEPTDRRYHYPFINCTNCGPRFTIVTGIPYDRPLTTMADFPLCQACRAEYEDPASRRFHAQPNACPDCGPQLRLFVTGDGNAGRRDPLAEACRRLSAGQIVAIKGLGGYHLAADATNEAAVTALRRRKQRDEKPFALMVKDLAAARELAFVNDLEARLLSGVERPIVLVKKRSGHGLAAGLAPNNRNFGIMLPYTPLHHLLFAQPFRALVMTSANLSDEPIAYQDEEARQRLAAVADAFLCHNRRIHVRTDDSIARVMAGQPLLLRRSRGYVPRAVSLPVAAPSVLAVGAELKNTVCLTRGDRAFLSQHVGDLQNPQAFASFRETIAHLQSILEVTPEAVAHDLHPDYLSTRYAEEECSLPLIAVQHHHAHLASCLAEHGQQDPAIGVIFDGVGYGDDQQIWGGEFLVGDLAGYQRFGHFRYQPMPGGDLATRHPWRMALSYLLTTYGVLPEGLTIFDGLDSNDLRLLIQAMNRRINAPLSSSCGRLFDAVAALIGLRQVVSFEGQAAMELEMVADPEVSAGYPFQLSSPQGQIIFDPSRMIREIVEDQLSGMAPSRIAGRFHRTLAEMITAVCDDIRQRTGLQDVVLSGGVFQNGLLTEMTVPRLTRAGFRVLTHTLVPPNDGGVALGQAAVALCRRGRTGGN
ncbi:MAG: carbamoyltransferase HypF [Desulfuromonadales bacterium]